MSNIAIKVDNLSKRYFIRDAARSDSLRDAVTSALRGVVRRGAGKVANSQIQHKGESEFWALKDVSFEVEYGEVLGILGPNGAGKSTLLKILSQITPPTTGRIDIYGRIGSLLEVGTGFNPELSGHENIYLYGAILGMDREQIRQHYDEIVDFAEIAKFVHQPIKHYSSGMHAKLGFSVAAHLDCEIMLVDEILSVGDAAFRAKSFRKMSQLIHSGRTVLFVSHNMSAVNNLCTRSVVLNNGQIDFVGDTGEAVNRYLATFGHRVEQGQSNPVAFEENSDKPLNILSAGVRNSRGEYTATVDYTESFSLELDVLVREESSLYYTGLWLRDSVGQLIVASTDEDLGPAVLSKLPVGRHRLTATFPARLFMPQVYKLSCAAQKKPTGQIDRKDDVLELTIEDNETWRAQQNLHRMSAAISPEMPWQSRPIDD